jgi:triosephosphate isomerase (TIM)
MIIAGNWKMHKLRHEAQSLAQEIKSAVAGESDLPAVILIPPFTAFEAVRQAIANSTVKLGAQNMDFHESGAFTGEVSAAMLVDAGVEYILIGHSERRQFFGETNATVNLRLKAALAHKLKPILCVGESLDEREANLADAVIGRQVGAALSDIDPSFWSNLIIAYEPVWAIGTGKNCHAKEASRVCGVIRKTLNGLLARFQEQGQSASGIDPRKIPILYGGSVKASNVDEQMQENEIDGALVGGASLNKDEFLAIVRAAQKRVKLALSSSKS